MAEEHRCQAPRLCANNCGFFGSPAMQDLCSKCYRDLQLKEQQSSSAKLVLNQTLAPPPPPSSPAVSSSLPEPVAAPSSLSSSSSVVDAPPRAAAAAAAAKEKIGSVVAGSISRGWEGTRSRRPILW